MTPIPIPPKRTPATPPVQSSQSSHPCKLSTFLFILLGVLVVLLIGFSSVFLDSYLRSDGQSDDTKDDDDESRPSSSSTSKGITSHFLGSKNRLNQAIQDSVLKIKTSSNAARDSYWDSGNKQAQVHEKSKTSKKKQDPGFDPLAIIRRQFSSFTGRREKPGGDDDDNNNNNQDIEDSTSLARFRKYDAVDFNVSTLPDHYFASTPNNGGFRGDCERVAGEKQLAKAWNETKRVACFVSNKENKFQNKGGDIKVEEHLIDYIDGKPSFRFYENVYISSLAGDFLGTGCRPGTYLIGSDGRRIDGELKWVRPLDKEMIDAKDDPKYLKFLAANNKKKSQNDEENDQDATSQNEDEDKSNAATQKQLERFGYDDDGLVLVRLVRFHLGNPYEAMHSYINTYLMLKAFGFDQTKVQFAFEDRQESTLRDDQFWKSFTLNQRPPIYRYTGTDGIGHTRRRDNPNQPVLVRRAIQGFSTGISVLVTSTSPLGGRAHDHPCSSSLAQNSIRWMRANFEKLGMLPPLPRDRVMNPRLRGGKIEVVWNARSVHARAGGKLLLPHRMIWHEQQFVLALREALGPDFKLRVVDFGKLDGPESIAAIETAQVLIGFHGAGLTWGMFMQPSHAAVIEIFGGNRPSSNRHYAGISKLMDFNYRSLTMNADYNSDYEWYEKIEGERRGMRWDHNFVMEVRNSVLSLPWANGLRRRSACPRAMSTDKHKSKRSSADEEGEKQLKIIIDT